MECATTIRSRTFRQRTGLRNCDDCYACQRLAAPVRNSPIDNSNTLDRRCGLLGRVRRRCHAQRDSSGDQVFSSRRNQSIRLLDIRLMESRPMARCCPDKTCRAACRTRGRRRCQPERLSKSAPDGRAVLDRLALRLDLAAGRTQDRLRRRLPRILALPGIRRCLGTTSSTTSYDRILQPSGNLAGIAGRVHGDHQFNDFRKAPHPVGQYRLPQANSCTASIGCGRAHRICLGCCLVRRRFQKRNMGTIQS